MADTIQVSPGELRAVAQNGQPSADALASKADKWVDETVYWAHHSLIEIAEDPIYWDFV
jgi:hypothetical protein